MPINPTTGFGFIFSGRRASLPGGFGLAQRKIKGSATQATFKGDVLQADGSNAGYLKALTSPGTQVIHGVAVGFGWQSKTVGYYIYRPFWLGNGDAVGDVDVFFINDPDAIFDVAAYSTGYTLADFGNNVQIGVGSGGNQVTGISSHIITGASATTATLPFRIYGLGQQPYTDPTVGYIIVKVVFNNQAYNQLTGGN